MTESEIGTIPLWEYVRYDIVTLHRKLCDTYPHLKPLYHQDAGDFYECLNDVLMMIQRLRQRLSPKQSKIEVTFELSSNNGTKKMDAQEFFVFIIKFLDGEIIPLPHSANDVIRYGRRDKNWFKTLYSVIDFIIEAYGVILEVLRYTAVESVEYDKSPISKAIKRARRDIL